LSRAPLTDRNVRALGLLVKAPNTGLPIQSPWLAVMNRQTEIARKLAAELALPLAHRNRAALARAGIGGVLLGCAVLAVRSRWADRLHLSCMLENRRMQRLARRFTHELRARERSTEAEIRLSYPSWPSLRAEAVTDAAGLAVSL
jgi:hypothetical protein